MINAKFRLTPVKIKKSYKSYISTKASKVFSSPENGRTTRHGYLPISVDQTTEEKKGMNFPLKLIYGGWNGKFLADDSTEWSYFYFPRRHHGPLPTSTRERDVYQGWRVHGVEGMDESELNSVSLVLAFPELTAFRLLREES